MLRKSARAYRALQQGLEQAASEASLLAAASGPASSLTSCSFDVHGVAQARRRRHQGGSASAAPIQRFYVSVGPTTRYAHGSSAGPWPLTNAPTGPLALLLLRGTAASPSLQLVACLSTSLRHHQPKDNQRTVLGNGSAVDKTPARGADAGACDEALGDYQALKSRFDKLQRPSSLKAWHEVLVDAARTVGSLSMAVGRFTLSIPKRVQDFREMPKDEWERWKAKAWETVKHEAHHYWVGTKLLGLELRISSRLAIKAARGKELSRRERQQLARTTADVFRLVPMVVILVIPFLEFALPFLLRIFPNMLPSTYEDKLKKEEELKRRLAIKLELARFLQDTVAEVAKDISRRKGSGSAKELYEFIKKVRSGQPVENAEILRFAQLFNDELTLDNLERVQLVSMCQFVGIAPFGTDAFLRSRLRAQLQQIKQDDYAIEQEGIENLTEDELRAACRARGMRGPFGEGAVAFMRRQLQDWLDLSLHRGLPSSLLLLSRAFTITASVQDVAQKKDLAYEKVKETLSVIPEEVVDKVGYEALGGRADSITDLEKKLDLLKREEALIKEELTRAAVAMSKKTAAAATAATAAAGKATSAVAAALSTAAPKEPAAAQPAKEEAEPLSAEALSDEERAAASAEERQRRVHKAVVALMDLAAGSGVAKERTMFLDILKKESERINADLAKSVRVAGGTQLVFSNRGMETGEREAAASGQAAADEDMVPKRLAERVGKLLASIEKELDKAEVSIGGRMRILDIDNDGIITQEELRNAVHFLKEQLSPEEQQQLFDALRDVAASKPGTIEVSKLLRLAADVDKETLGKPEGESVKIHMK